jgi:hypothetical protein
MWYHSINTIKYQLFDDPLWTAEMCEVLCIQEFLDIMEYSLSNVEVCYL